MKFVSAFLILMAAIPAFASRVGNGGFVINCGGKVQLFDYYLAEQKGLHISSALGNPDLLNPVSSAEMFLKRLAPVDPNRSANFRGLIREYYSSKGYQMIPGSSLTLNSEQAADPIFQEKFGLGSIQIPSECQLILAIMQVDPSETHDDPRTMHLKIFSEVWNNLDQATQAGLLLHELFYFEHLHQRLPPFDSSGVRELNGMLGSDEFLSLSSSEWNDILKKNHFLLMFPNFQYPNSDKYPRIFAISEVKNQMDYQLSLALKPYPTLTGQVDICGKPYELDTRSETFFDGFFPSNSVTRVDVSAMDLSCVSKTPLVLSLTAQCPINFGRLNTEKTPALTAAGADPTANRVCIGTLQKFENQNIEFVGPIYAYVERSGKLYLLNLIPSDFGVLKVIKNGQKLNVKNRAVVNLETGLVESAN